MQTFSKFFTIVGTRAYARRVVVKKPLELDVLRNLYYMRRGLIVFPYFLLVNLSTECKHNGKNLHANFKEQCKWPKNY